MWLGSMPNTGLLQTSVVCNFACFDLIKQCIYIPSSTQYFSCHCSNTDSFSWSFDHKPTWSYFLFVHSETLYLLIISHFPKYFLTPTESKTLLCRNRSCSRLSFNNWLSCWATNEPFLFILLIGNYSRMEADGKVEGQAVSDSDVMLTLTHICTRIHTESDAGLRRQVNMLNASWSHWLRQQWV